MTELLDGSIIPKAPIVDAFASRPLDEIRADLSRPLLLLFHGRGSDEERFAQWIPKIPEEYDIIRFRGPLIYDDGFTWASPVISGTAITPGITYDDGAYAVEHWLDAHGLDTTERRISIGGFSAGGILSFQLFARRPARYRHVISLSGFISPDIPATVDDTGSSTQVFWGIDPVADGVVPDGRIASTSAWLKMFGASERHYPNTGHEIRAEEFEDVVDLLATPAAAAASRSKTDEGC